jgi:hypothetical protein
MRLRIVACEIFFRELSLLAARSPHKVDIEFLPKGLHDQGGAAMRERLQAAIDAADATRYDAVLLAYGLCNNGLAGLAARSLPLVLIRAHDCITAFLGSRDRYAAYFSAEPGTYFETTGWIERGAADGGPLGLGSQTGLGLDRQALALKYGEENAEYLMEELGDLTRHYKRMAFIRMGVEPDGSFEARCRDLAAERGWQLEVVEGDLGLLRRLVNGAWDEADFLVVPPGQSVVPTHRDDIVATREASS